MWTGAWNNEHIFKGLHFPFEGGCENSDLEAADTKGLIAITEPEEGKCG